MSFDPVALPRIEDRERLDRIIDEGAGRPGFLLGVLERLQEQHRAKFLPLDTLAYVAQRADIPESQVIGVATFYTLFNLEPQGTHTISICRGTACHTRGSRVLLERLRLEMGAQKPEDEGGVADEQSFTTPDQRFTVRTVACFGQCALAPVAEIDRAIRGHVNERALLRDVKALRQDATQ